MMDTGKSGEELGRKISTSSFLDILNSVPRDGPVGMSSATSDVWNSDM